MNARAEHTERFVKEELLIVRGVHRNFMTNLLEKSGNNLPANSPLRK
jgi:hypothetical protein